MDRLADYDRNAEVLDTAIARGDMTTLHRTIKVFKRQNNTDCKKCVELRTMMVGWLALCQRRSNSSEICLLSSLEVVPPLFRI